MDTAGKTAEQLGEQISKAEAELQALREQLAQVEARNATTTASSAAAPRENGHADWKWPLRATEYERYGRQLILPQIGIAGQKRLKSSRVLIVGAGGLGCPAAAYLAGAGVGTLGIVDGDVVEPSNLHRQIAHGTSRVGMWKVDSLITYCKELNPLPTYIPHREHLTPENAELIVREYDLVLDCTDHPTSRYLISDICVLLLKPLVSASALRTDGQLIVLNTPPTPQGTGPVVVHGADSPLPLPLPPPCYRCVFPRPPPPDAVVSCGEGGVLGPVVGVMGVLQALEAVKIIAAGLHLPLSAGAGAAAGAAAPSGAEGSGDDGGGSNAGGIAASPPPPPTLLLLSGATVGAPAFRSVKMRSRRKDCFACGFGESRAGEGAARLTLDMLRSGSLDYVAFCGGASAPVQLLRDGERISAREYSSCRRLSLRQSAGPHQQPPPHLLLDVREKELFDIASIDGAINVPYSRIQSTARRKQGGAGASVGSAAAMCTGKEEEEKGKGEEEALPDWMPQDLAGDTPIYVVCRVGNDSQVVAKQLLDAGLDRKGRRWIGDIRGGMRAWRDEVDRTLPFL